jgi:nucleoside-diphosphate-sugar epimerase
MNVLLIGGTRFIGAHIVTAFARTGHAITLFNRGSREETISSWIGFIKGDKNKRKDFEKLLAREDFDIIIDTICTADDLKFAIPLLKGRIKHYIHCGSTGVYAPTRTIPSLETDPCDPPAAFGAFAEKLAQDQVLTQAWEEDKFPVTILRPTNVCGSGDLPLELFGGRNPELWRSYARGGPIIIPNDGQTLVQPVYAADLAKAFVLAAVNREKCISKIYNISSARAVTHTAYAEMIREVMGTRNPIEFAAGKAILREYGRYINEPGFLFHCEHMCTSIEAAGRDLGYDPVTPINVALKDSIGWMRAEGIIQA